ncbi:hypothetical protein HY345_01510 [Candidatus Microgenomates bacterium]|nr:hypothetical protein [Candidatus Microgenomates bacterium]
MENNIGEVFTLTILGAFDSISMYFPRFLAGLLVLLIGLLLAGFAKRVVLGLFRALRVGKFLVSVRMVKEEGEIKVWEVLLAELVRWSLTILFLVPTAEAWGLSKVTDILNQLLIYLPNVFVAVIVGSIGVVIANLTYDVVKQGTKSIGGRTASTLSTFARYAIMFFTVLVVLNQLGVAADLVRILFTGLVAMLALAGGLAFGLGGQELAKQILRELKDKLEK